MKVLSVLFFLATAFAQSSTPAPKPPAAKPAEPSPDAVLVTYGDGQKLTYGEFKRFLVVLPPAMQQQAMRDRKSFMQQFALMHSLARMAERNKLDRDSPTKEQLEYNRLYVLTQAQINHAANSVRIDADEIEKVYNENPDRFRHVNVKVLYVSFVGDPKPQPGPGGKKPLTEEQAKAKIEKLLAAARGGADFVKLVKENSEDETSRAKNGDFGTIRQTDSLPDAIRNAIFALRKGQISEPIRQPNGFYLFRAEDVSVRPLNEVHDEIFNQIKDARFKAWMDKTNQSLNVKYVDEAFFNQSATAAPPAAK